jgi:hypothetical protein
VGVLASKESHLEEWAELFCSEIRGMGWDACRPEAEQVTVEIEVYSAVKESV